jgi:hypothetical protein
MAPKDDDIWSLSLGEETMTTTMTMESPSKSSAGRADSPDIRTIIASRMEKMKSTRSSI